MLRVGKNGHQTSCGATQKFLPVWAEASKPHESMELTHTRFRELQSRYNVEQRNIWNMDEHGIACGVCANSMVLARSGKKRTNVKSPKSREWVSIIETISASGKSTRPLINFKSSNPQSTWFPENPPPWIGNIRHPKMDGLVITLRFIGIGITAFKLWMVTEVTTTEFLWICKQSNVELLFLPTHSSHVHQPLDLGVFAPLNSRYLCQIADVAKFDNALAVKKQKCFTCDHDARITHSILVYLNSAGKQLVDSHGTQKRVLTHPRSLTP
ncbi:hypothetical protein K3495_g4784 [Podosphaera aphanis]|nr:hypothetical protein K3495_g4784 [Podosphaera aphanis]